MNRSARRTGDLSLLTSSPTRLPEDVFEVAGRWASLLVLLGLAICSAACFLLPGCTVRPKIVHNSQASFDANVQNSGLLGIDQAGNRIITPHARDRYNELMVRYGKLWNPPVQPGEGLMPTATNTFLLDAQHAFYFETANRWFHQGK